MASSSSSTSKEGASPLWMTPLWNCTSRREEEDYEENGHYEILQRIVGTHGNNNNAEMETALETFVHKGVALWRRVVVRSLSRVPVIHASYRLAQNNNESILGDDSVLCWTSFPTRPQHQMLCVLASPTVLCIWDVYPQPNNNNNNNSSQDLGSGEGHSIPLPFEASGIHAMMGQGLLLQRKETLEDRFAALDAAATATLLGDEDMEDMEEDGFILKAPPRPVRLRESTGTTTTTTNLHISTTNMSNNNNHSSVVVPSLFSLSHPLDDVLPISRLPAAGDFGAAVTDVLEKILFVGVLRWTDPSQAVIDRTEYSQPICVTYHAQRKRHAIWELKPAPPPPPQAPLWQVSSQWRSDNGWNSHLGVLQQDLEDLELLEPFSPDNNSHNAVVDSSHYETTSSRHEALADALGVRKTPRKAVVDDLPPPRKLSSTVRSNRSHRKANVSLLSPALSMTTRLLNETTTQSIMDADNASVENSFSRPPLLTLGPFSSLHPNIAMTCLYEETTVTPQAETIFLASNLTGSGILNVCLVCPGNNNDISNPNELRQFSFEPSGDDAAAANHRFQDASSSGALLEGIGKIFFVAPKPTIPCVAAQPMETSPIPPCFHPHRRNRNLYWNGLASDILVLSNDKSGQGKLSLYRSCMYIVDCAIPNKSRTAADTITVASTVYDIENAVGNRIDIICSNDADEEICVRGSVSLMMDSSALGEKVLQTLESVLLSPNNNIFLQDRGQNVAMKIRADCARLEQMIAKRSKDDSSQPFFEDVGAAAVRSVVLSMFCVELLGDNVNYYDYKKIAASDHGGTTAWDRLLQSEYHQFYSTECQDFLFIDESKDHPGQSNRASKDNTFILGGEYLSQIHSFAVESITSLKNSISCTLFDALHALYEDFKLCGSLRDAGMRFLGTILCRVCQMIRSDSKGSKNIASLFMEHYRRDLGDLWFQQLVSSKGSPTSNSQEPSKTQIFSAHGSPPCILSWLDGLVSGKATNSGYNDLDLSSVNAAYAKTFSILRIFPLLYSSTNELNESDRKQCNRDHNVVRILIEEGFATQATLRDELPAGVALPLLEVLHRCRSDHEIPRLSYEDAEMWSLIGREDLCKNLRKTDRNSLSGDVTSKSARAPPSSDLSKDQNVSLEDKDLDGICPLEITSSMLFPEDNRIREVGRLLRSSRPVHLNVPRAIEVSDHDYERLKQEKLLSLSRRVLALPVGRGMFTIGNLKPVPAEPLPLPNLCLVGRVPPTNAQLALDTGECPADLKVWPEFHNGVAAGLRLPLEQDAGEMISKITRTWIVYNRPPKDDQNPAQNNPNQPNNSSQSLGHAHGGLLMALGLRGHLTTLEMTDIFDYLTHGTVTTTVGVLLGMAANMRGTCDISVSKMLCLHIPSLIPQHFSAIDVASPVQAAAVAGAGLLYQGSSHRMMTEFLLNEIGKRPSSDVNVLDREAYNLSCGIALGMVNLCQGEGLKGDLDGSGNAGLADLRIEDRLYRYIVGGLDDAEMRRRRDETDRLSLPSTSAASGNEKCSCVHEGESINTDVTAPGATLALGLIYMKSGNKTIASAISLPDTHFLLEYVRPDFLMLRVIARALILWDDVKPSKAWIESQLPLAVRSAYEQMRDLAQRINQQESGSSSAGQDKDFDRQAVRLIYAHVIAGACFAIGLRFAGTGNREAAAAIFERVMELRDLRDGNDPVSCALRPAAPVLEMCLGCAAISLSMVLAGTGDLETLRLLKVLRWRCDDDVNYGSHMAYGAAIGLLFLGGAACTLGREPEDIAALVMSFYPRYPSTTSDNQYHLQALRNLYALAVKNREIRAIDVDTGECVFVPVEVHFEDKYVDPLSLTAPCLLLNTDSKPRQLRVVSERYYPVSLNLKDPVERQTFFVKRRSAHLSYRQDPHAQRSLLVQTGSFQGGVSLDLIASFTDDQKVLAFAQHLCDVGGSFSSAKPPGPFSVAGFCSRVLHECLMLDTEEALPLYLAIRSAVVSVQAGVRSAVPFIWDFRLIRSYYEERRRLVPDGSPRLLNSELVTYLNELMENAIAQEASTGEKAKDGPLSIYYDVPIDSDLKSLSISKDSDIMDLS